MRFKTLIAALVAVTTGTASANLLVKGHVPGKPSDLLVSIYDATPGGSGKTFLFNTRIKYSDIVNGLVGSKSFDLAAEPAFQLFRSQATKLKFNVVGGYSLADDYSNFDASGIKYPFTDPAKTQWGLVTTGKSLSDFNGLFSNLSDTTKSRIFSYFGAANVKLYAAGATAAAGTNSVSVDKGDIQASFDLAWGGNFGGGATANSGTANIAVPGDSAKFFWVSNNDLGNGSVTEVGVWTLSEDGKLSYTGSGSGGGNGGGNGGGVTNSSPIALAGSNKSVATGVSVILDGSASSDPDGDVLNYSWTQISGSPVTLSGASSAKAGFKAVSAGTYGFQLTVSDGKASSNASVQITVTEALPSGPYVRLRAPTTWQVGKPQVISFISNGLNPKLKHTIQFARSSGGPFKTIATVALKKGSFRWKPAKSHQTSQGILKSFVKNKGAIISSLPVTISVAPK